jgi:pyruvate/2-oxoglutarate dehydrogenase complex dihydrolipoamide acyltransferase (E2) component
MENKRSGYRVIPFPAARKVIVDAGRQGSHRHLIHGLLEIDVTRPLEMMHEHETRTGEKLSFTGFIVKCFAQAVSKFPSVQAYRNWRNQLILFEDVDVVTMIETKVGGVALPHVLRSANQKTFQQIHAEIRSVQTRPAHSTQSGGLVDLAPRLPAFVRDIFYWGLRQNPHWFKQIQGTVIVTAVGMFVKNGGWGFGFLPFHTLGLTVGGITSKPGIVDGTIAIRQYLDLTISLDHDIVDGADAARFARYLSELIESGEVLVDQAGADP